MTSTAEILDFTSRDLDQEIDTIEIIPEHPDFIIVGTYHLQKSDKPIADEVEGHEPPASRVGSLQVLPFNHNEESQSSTECNRLVRKDFQCGIVDIRFHPQHATLLGAATSTGEIRIFNIIREQDVEEVKPSFHIIEIGIVTIYDPTEYESLPLITQFKWVESQNTLSDSANIQLSLVTCDSFGSSKFIRTNVSTITASSDLRLKSPSWTPNVPHETIDIHKQSHGLEAWTISTLALTQTNPDTQTIAVMSGGDDSNLIASKIEVPTDPTILLNETAPPNLLSTNKTTHEAGVVSILPLPLPISKASNPTQNPFYISTNITSVPSNTSIPILTGSYDETIRLFHFNTTTKTPTLTSSFPLAGGVWRITLLTSYSTTTTTTTTPSQSSNHHQLTNHYILLISLMYSGAMILRLTETIIPDHTSISDRTYKWTIEATFKAGHESMVYACVARSDDSKDGGRSGQWNIVSTSFYDRKVCNWGWVDRVQRDIGA